MKNNSAIAYAEIDEILDLMDKKYVAKIPHKFKDFLNREKEQNYM